MHVVPIILCGGSGTRLWPLSRRDFAKQHVPLLGGDSPFQRTLRRLADAGGDTWERPTVITGESTRFMAAEQARRGVAAELVLEPEGRDTLAAITLGTLLAARRGPDTLVLILPSDHLIPDVEAFGEAVSRAAEAAAKGALVTFGIRPTGPATGYGYIRPGAAREEGDSFVVSAFVEKPDAERAAELVAEGCLWNSGMFAFTAETALAEIRARAPECFTAVSRALIGAEPEADALRLGADFATAPKISFDYAIMEKTSRAAVVPVDFAWSDIGDWREIWNLSPRDADGVVSEGPVATRDVQNSYIRADGRLVCAIGLERVLIVDTPDALLVADLDRAQEVKMLVAELGAAGRPEIHTPARVHRPWGWYQTMDLGDRFRVKRIQVSPGKQLSLQRHHHRAEHWVVVRGTAEVTRDNETVMVRENESVYLPMGCLHRLRNPGKIPVEIVEVQTGAYLEEDDIIRVEDDFGRSRAS